MRASRYFLPAVLAAALLAIACESGSPSRPAVSIVSPRASTPAAGAQIKGNQQPITLSVRNAVRTTGEAATYTFEVARESAFTAIVSRRDNVPEGPDGVTSTQIDTLEPDENYYWRVRARVVEVDGLFSQPQPFRVLIPVIIQAPIVVEPSANSATYGDRPVFIVKNAHRTGPAGAILYDFQIAADSAFSKILAEGTVPEDSRGETSFSADRNLPEGRLFWRARATDPENDAIGPFISAVPFDRLEGIDLARVVYQMGPNISSWPETSKITEAYFADGLLCIFHTKLGVWPAGPFFDVPGPIVEGNQWIFAKIGGQWYGGASEWYRPGQACKAADSNIAADSFTAQPLASWRPRSGEVFGVMSTTPARLWPDMKTIDQRTNVMLIKWP